MARNIQHVSSDYYHHNNDSNLNKNELNINNSDVQSIVQNKENERFEINIICSPTTQHVKYGLQCVAYSSKKELIFWFMYRLLKEMNIHMLLLHYTST